MVHKLYHFVLLIDKRYLRYLVVRAVSQGTRQRFDI